MVISRRLAKMTKVLYGNDAIKEVERKEGPLNNVERYIVKHEGYVKGEYLDTKGIRTGGVGQTGKWLTKSFVETFQHHEFECAKLVPMYALLEESVRMALMSLMYRGDLQQSPNFRKLFNQGDILAACEELLDHKEYLDPDTPTGIKRRLKEAHDFIKTAYVFNSRGHDAVRR
jgi:GH24 family phage-related lysozyme (muramidase)